MRRPGRSRRSRKRDRCRGRLLGADHLLPGARGPGGGGAQGAPGLPPAGSRACLPGKGYRGVETVLGSVEGLKRFVSIRESPYHGLNFCQGTVSEMLQDPGREIFDVIRYFGSRRKIFNVHFRNIQGRFLDFRETFIDDGDVDMLAALRVYREVGFDGMMMPDHVPHDRGRRERTPGLRVHVRLHQGPDPGPRSGDRVNIWSGRPGVSLVRDRSHAPPAGPSRTTAARRSRCAARPGRRRW